MMFAGYCSSRIYIHIIRVPPQNNALWSCEPHQRDLERDVISLLREEQPRNNNSILFSFVVLRR